MAEIVTHVSGKEYRVKTGTSGSSDTYDQLSFKTDSSDVSFPNGRTLKQNYYDYASGVLTAGQTSLIITSPLISTDGMLDIYVPVEFCKVTPNTIQQMNGQVVLTFPVQSSNMEVRIRCT